MNNARRKVIRSVIKQLQGRNPNLDDIRSDLEDILADEEDARDNTPESLLDSDAYMIREESCEHLQEAIDEIDNIEEDHPGFSAVIAVLENIDGI